MSPQTEPKRLEEDTLELGDEELDEVSGGVLPELRHRAVQPDNSGPGR
jgi:hypothetical protein